MLLRIVQLPELLGAWGMAVLLQGVWFAGVGYLDFDPKNNKNRPNIMLKNEITNPNHQKRLPLSTMFGTIFLYKI